VQRWGSRSMSKLAEIVESEDDRLDESQGDRDAQESGLEELVSKRTLRGGFGGEEGVDSGLPGKVGDAELSAFVIARAGILGEVGGPE